uniref:GH18 domain-containing protein n=1 Tax=Octopus bimaculoides TaxID=37653 RepID=A0A0L8HGQ9_OCTBM
MAILRLLTLSTLLTLIAANNATYRRVCYYTNWSQTVPAAGKFEPEDINPYHCTHICYAFAKLDGNHIAPTRPWNKDSNCLPCRYERTLNLKKINPSLKILISLGGWDMGSAPFTAMVANAANRKDFIDHAITWMRKRGFDGLDIDWEYPANRGSPPEDKNRFSMLIKETKLAFEAEAKSTGNERLLLACAVSAGQDKIDTGYDIPEISKYFDFITIMTYDLHGAWEKFTGHNSPLHVRSDEKGLQRHLNVEWAANYWVKKGAPKSILNVGLALYGRGFTLSNPAQSNPGDPAKGASNKGPFTREGGFLSYYEICKMIATGGKVSWIKDQEVPYVVKGNQWVGYDNPKSLTIKVNWIKANGFGGIAVWALPLDDFNGQCGGEKYPLMKSIVRALGDKIVVPPHTAPNTFLRGKKRWFVC